MTPITNHVKLIGDLGFDPEIREIATDRYVGRFSLFTRDRYKNQHGEVVEDVQWHTIVAWGSVAKLVLEKLKKGMSIELSGRLVHRSYADAKGTRRYIAEVIMNEFWILPNGTAKDE